MTTVLGIPQISQTLLEDLDRVGRKYKRWTAQAYFELDGNYLTEYSRGTLEILPMPTIEHQDVARRIYDALRVAVPREDRVMFAWTRLKVAEDVFREPDVLYIPASLGKWVHKQYAERAALVVEVLSESNREHDLTTKRSEYAQAGVPEYWIVDADGQRITILKLDGDHYVVHGEFSPGDRATSALLPAFAVEVTEILTGA
jgi:Uma2 family endonuclease